jgi:hypothetical protein
MPILDGYLIVAKDVPTFVIPVLVDRPRSNHSLIQQIDIDDRITSFFEVDVGNNYEDTSFNFEFNVGDQAIWGFRSLSGEVTFGDFITLKKDLESRFFASEFNNYPLIEAQIAKFCGLSSAYSSALAKSYELMQRRSKLAATIWRDCSVLLPLARKELARFLPRHLISDVDDVRLIGTGKTILLELPQRMHDFLNSEANDLKLADSPENGWSEAIPFTWC